MRDLLHWIGTHQFGVALVATVAAVVIVLLHPSDPLAWVIVALAVVWVALQAARGRPA